MSDSKRRWIENSVFKNELFSEKIYSEEPNERSNTEQPSFDIHKDECQEFRTNGNLCIHEQCYNRLFYKRLEKFNFSDRLNFIKHQIVLRRDKSKFIEELEMALYDSQKLFEPEVYKHYIEILNEQKEIVKKEMVKANSAHELGNKVFIIHGHDEELKKATQLFVTRIGLDDVVLHEQPDRGRTIITKLIEESDGACFALALLSPDDEIADGNVRARQNVILELGYFIGLLGMERVRILKKGNVEIPSDLHGVIYQQYDSNGQWQIKLIREMEDVDIELDKDNLLSKF